MRTKRKNDGFSLTEVLMSVGILTVGLIFVAGVFPVGIHFATIASERTIAAVVADEAFAKIKLYGVDVDDLTRWPGVPTQPLDIDRTLECVDFNDVSYVPLNFNEFAYPSTGVDISEKKFYWSALCRRKDPSTSLVQVTVFVYRKVGAVKSYWDRELMTDPPLQTAVVPKPIKAAVRWTGPNLNELVGLDLYSSDDIDEATFINDGCTIVDDQTGQRFRILERYISATDDDIILLDGNWPFTAFAGDRLIWVVPPPSGGGRNPCIAIYQKEIQF
jgi:hypothetical protein